MKDYIRKIKAVWYQDNCHTYDRENMYAQIDCGIGNNDDSLRDALTALFSLKFFPFIQDPQIKTCLFKVLPESPDNTLPIVLS